MNRECGHPLGNSAWCIQCAEAEMYATPRERAETPQASPEPSAWIAVTERLPQEGVRVLAWAAPQDGIAYVYGREWASATLMGIPTHWMPLPDAPRAQAKGAPQAPTGGDDADA